MGVVTHPFASHRDRLVYPSPRYRMLLDRNQWIARRMAIFGLHVHVGPRPYRAYEEHFRRNLTGDDCA